MYIYIHIDIYINMVSTGEKVKVGGTDLVEGGRVDCARREDAPGRRERGRLLCLPRADIYIIIYIYIYINIYIYIYYIIIIYYYYIYIFIYI